MNYAHQKSKTFSDHLHQEMMEDFGLPTPSQSYFEEVFGCYHVLDETRYWTFDPINRLWDVKVEENRPAKLIAAPASWTAKDRKDVWKRLRDLSYFAPPSLPRDPTRKMTGKPFVYDGWLFAWTFLPELRRWELAPLDKR